MSNCEIIGHRISSKTIEKCTTPPQICDIEPNSNACLSNAKTADQCATEIASENAQMADSYFAFKCPKSEELLRYQSQPRVTRANNYVDVNNAAIDTDVLLADIEHIYVFRMGAGLAGALGGYTPDITDYVLGTPDKDGLNLTEIK